MLARSTADEGTTYDFFLLAVVLILLVFGSIMVISAGSFIAAEKFNNENYFISSQIKNAVIALIAFIFGMLLNYRIYNNKILMYAGMAVTVLALAYLLISNQGESIKGAKRWIFGFQPSELAKNMIVFYFAYSLNKYRQLLEQFLRGYVLHLVILCAIVGMVFLQPAFSTSMMIFAMYLMLSSSM